MKWADLPPVGDPVRYGPAAPLPSFRGYEAIWLASGTAALALALIAARLRRPHLQTPEVILPAYGCPDLVAACVHAEVKPRLVDIQADDPGYDLGALASAINGNTLAVVAVNFLGLGERLGALRDRLADSVMLLEDSAQCYPDGDLCGDAVITSFGRGKPASVLGGGLLLLREGFGVSAADLSSYVSEAPAGAAKHRLKVALYNALLRPRCYFWLNRNPCLKLGETVYKSLDTIHAMPASLRELVAVNVSQWRARSRDLEARYEAMLERYAGVEAMARGEASRLRAWLRYPVICADQPLRDRLYADLRARGLGASLMYRRPLLQIPGVAEDVLAPDSYPGAEAFARRLLTLPIHSGVCPQHVDEMKAVFSTHCAVVAPSAVDESATRLSEK